MVLALVLAPLGWFAINRLGDDDQSAAGAGATDATSPDAGDLPTDPTSPPAGDDLVPDEPGNPLDDLLGPDGPLGDIFGEDFEDQLDGLDPDTLACLTPPDAAPSFEGSQIPDDPAEAIATISEQVEIARELQFDTEVSLELLSDQQLSDRVVAVTDEDWPVEEADLDDAILTRLGQIDPSQDLRTIYLDLLGEQVAGFYDPDSGELVAEANGDLRPVDQVTIAHELDHALTDQVLQLPDLGGDPADTDASLAIQGLVEGDATVLMQHWAVSHLSLMDQLSMGATEIDTTQLDDAPWALQAGLLYPYEQGLEFVCSLYLQGGWAAVDAAYQDLPTNSAQVLWPERYRDRVEPVAPGAVTAPEGWQQARSTTWGAADLLWLIEAPGDDLAQGPEDAMARAADWAGGHQTTWQSGDQTMVSLELVQQPGGQLCTTMADWIGAAWPGATADRVDNVTQTWDQPDHAVALTCDGDAVQAVLGPDLAAVTAVG